MTDCKSMLEMQAKCWDYLINLQRFDSSFYFVPRKINKYHRLEQGYYFIGNDEYMQVSFWNGSDSYEKIHNINWGVDKYGLCFIEISAKDNADRATYLSELVSILEQKIGVSYYDLSKNKWRYDYPKDVFYLDTLQSFIDNIKPIIDEYIIKHPGSGISMLDKEFNQRYVINRLHTKSPTIKTGKNKKQEGEVSVSPSSYLMAFHHNELQNAMVEYLNTDSNNKSVDSEIKYVDITVKTTAGEKIFYELKTSDVKNALRLAIGQLLEYSHYSNNTKADKLIIVTKYAANSDDIAYIQRLRILYQIPIYYQCFDMVNKKLSAMY